jgi:hypothetical protein
MFKVPQHAQVSENRVFYNNYLRVVTFKLTRFDVQSNNNLSNNIRVGGNVYVYVCIWMKCKIMYI